MIDTHCHLYFEQFSADLEEVLLRAREAGVDRAITIAIDRETGEQCLEIVNRFPGHIACDPNSKSEIVIPLFAPGTPPPSPETTKVSAQPIGVLDIDSPELDRFDTTDSYYLERFNRLVSERLG